MATFRVPEDRGRIPFLEYMGKYMTAWMYVYFGATTFLVRYLMQPLHEDYFICEIVGPVLGLLLDVILAYITAQVIFKLNDRKKQRIQQEAGATGQ